MERVPVVRFFEPWRALIAYAILAGISGGLTLIGAAALGQPVDVTNIQSLLLIVALIASGYSILVASIYQRIFRDEQEALKALKRQDYEATLAASLRMMAVLEKRPWLDRWRTVLFLNMSRASLAEIAESYAADAYARLGRVGEAIELYERCLADRPDNVLALNSLNLINLFVGRPLRPERDIIHRYAYDSGHRSYARYFPYAVSGLLGLVFIFPLMMQLIRVGEESLSAFVIPLIVFMTVLFGFPPGFRWVTRHAFLPDMIRGVDLVKRGDYIGAIEAFERQYNGLKLNGFVDQMRLLLLFEPSACSYREWLLLYQVIPWRQIGRPDRVIALLEECLKLNPHNVYARSSLDLVRHLQSAVAQVTGNSPIV